MGLRPSRGSVLTNRGLGLRGVSVERWDEDVSAVDDGIDLLDVDEWTQ